MSLIQTSSVPTVWTVWGPQAGGHELALRTCAALGVLCIEASPAVPAQDNVPTAILLGLPRTAAELLALVRWIDQLRQAQPALPVLLSPTLVAGANPELLQACREQLLPRTTLLAVHRSEAAALLGLPPLKDQAAVEQAASALRALGCQGVVVTGGDNASSISEDYADTAQARGWLSLPRLAAHAGNPGAVFAASAAAALARGFVAMEAIILASMATADALLHSDAGTLQPRADFAQHSDNLPYFSLPVPTAVSGFAALSDVDLGLYAVVDSAAWVERVVAAGVRTVQLRIKDAEQPAQREHVRQQVRQSIAAARAAGAQLFINDHWQLAIEEGAYGVHLGQEDLHIADLAAIAQAGLRLGISTHAYWEVCRAWALQPSYIACGPIHPTQAKAMPWVPQGNGNLAYWCALLPTPVVGIAGMNAARILRAAQCGVAGVAVISAITAAASPETAITQLQQAVQRGRSGPPATAPFLPKSTLLPTV